VRRARTGSFVATQMRTVSGVRFKNRASRVRDGCLDSVGRRLRGGFQRRVVVKRFQTPGYIFVDGSSDKIYRIDGISGAVSGVAGVGLANTGGNSEGDGGPALQAFLDQPYVNYGGPVRQHFFR
jgi:hypothetical protein